MISNVLFWIARSLKSFNRIQDQDGQSKQVYNLHRFQNLVYTEDYDIVCVSKRDMA
jgi:hypothetical protein